MQARVYSNVSQVGFIRLGVLIDDSGQLTLKVANSNGKQQGMLLTMTDMILHFRDTIR